MGILIGIVIFLVLWLGVFLACIILPIVALARTRPDAVAATGGGAGVAATEGKVRPAPCGQA